MSRVMMYSLILVIVGQLSIMQANLVKFGGWISASLEDEIVQTVFKWEKVHSIDTTKFVVNFGSAEKQVSSC